jgi:hypothetical protein
MLLFVYTDLLDKTFEKYNYKYPQPLIKIFGINIIIWILNYLNIFLYEKIIIIYNNEFYKYEITHELKSNFPEKEFIFIYKLPENSIYDIIKKISIKDECLLINTKYFFLKNILNLTNYKNTIFLINNDLNDNTYNDYSSFINETSILYMNNEINIFQKVILDDEYYISLETAFHIRLFCNNFPKINALNNNQMICKKTFSFDYDDIINGYLNSIIQYLYKIGNNIIIETTQPYENKLLIEEDLLKKNIKYHFIYFEKPKYDFHISTKSIKYNDNLEKELGFFFNKVEPRDYNDIIETNLKTFKKISFDLSGEIHYYLNIPNQIKDIFPIMFNYDKEYKFYEMERINGIPVSKLYLNEELTLEQFDNVLGTIKRIHSIKDNADNNISKSIYNNYSKKLKKRYDEHKMFYDIFDNSNELYNLLYNELYNYEFNNNGIVSMIHGDTVFTNIIINNLGKIKLIDMRGKLGDVLSIYGDQLYDWAKIYQSLIGYDEILDDKLININYKSTIIKYFLDKFKEIYVDPIYIYFLNIITASLIFTLIPLHNNEKCIKYYKLIENLNLNKSIIT